VNVGTSTNFGTKRHCPYNFDAAADFPPISEKLCSIGVLKPHPEAISERKDGGASLDLHII
jgi:hypothetical protein